MRISHLETTRACTLSEISDLKREISSLHSIIQTMVRYHHHHFQQQLRCSCCYRSRF